MPEGYTLEDSMKKENLPLSVRISILIDIAQGLDFLHIHNFAHGNLSPKYILIDKDSLRARVSGLYSVRDIEPSPVIRYFRELFFGLEENIVNQIFMAPEQGKGVTDVLSDIYSFGKLIEVIISDQNLAYLPKKLIVLKERCTEQKRRKRPKNMKKILKALLEIRRDLRQERRWDLN